MKLVPIVDYKVAFRIILQFTGIRHVRSHTGKIFSDAVENFLRGKLQLKMCGLKEMRLNLVDNKLCIL